MCIWGALSVNANRMKQSLNRQRRCLSRISAGATEKLLGWKKPHAQTVAWTCDTEGHAQKFVERYFESTNKKVEQCTMFQILAWMTINSSRENLNQLENCHKHALKLP